jgi:hypothetical protein
MIGALGSGCVEAEVWNAAREVIEREQPRHVSFSLGQDADAVLKIGVTQKDQAEYGDEYSDDFSLQLARSSSATPHRCFSSSVWLAGMRVWQLAWKFSLVIRTELRYDVGSGTGCIRSRNGV